MYTGMSHRILTITRFTELINVTKQRIENMNTNTIIIYKLQCFNSTTRNLLGFYNFLITIALCSMVLYLVRVVVDNKIEFPYSFILPIFKTINILYTLLVLAL